MKYRRKEFIRLAAFGGLGLYLSACHTKSGAPAAPVQDSISALKPPAAETAESTITYIKKGDERYDELRQGFNKRIDKYPAAIALCKNSSDVSEAVLHAKKNKWPVAVKSGGHCLEGFSCNNDGLVINLSRLNAITWNEDGTVTVGPACKLSQIYDELLPKGKFIPAGSCGSVGIGGLTLGGGYGMFSRQYGLTCDSLLEVTMVDGNGNVLNSKNDNDLMWACRGGGSGNFGVVTEMRLKVHDAPATLTSHRFRAYKVDAARATAIVEQWMNACGKLPESCFSALVLNGHTLLILLTNFGKQTTMVEEVMFQFTSITDKASLGKPSHLAAAVKVFYGEHNPVYFKNSCGGMYKGFEDVKPFMSQVLDTIINTPGMIYSMGTLGGKIQDKDAEAASAFPHRAYPFLGELQAYWESPKQEAHYTEKSRAIIQLLQANGVNAEYRNYPSLDFENAQEKYYGANYSRLQRLKAKYDPDNVFRYEQSVKS